MIPPLLRRFRLLAALILLILNSLFIIPTVWAESCDPSCSGIEECQKKITECQKLLEISVKATKPHEEKVAELEEDITALEANIASLSREVDKRVAAIARDEGKLVETRERFQSKVKEWYIKNYSLDGNYFLTLLFGGQEVLETVKVVSLHEQAVNKEKRIIAALALDIMELNAAREKLVETQTWLAGQKASLEQTLAPIRDLVQKAKSYQGQLGQTVGSLTARQQQLLAEKTGSFQITVGDVPAADDPASRPDYNPGFSPAYAGFSFGAPHRRGMSQYGAFGRAKSGQNAEEILRAYFGGGIEIKKDYSTAINITVDGYGTVDIETYVQRIYEVPNSWADQGGMEALKAQAVAARSYALARTNNGASSICPTESCQVYKPANKGGKWEEAVNATRGWVLMVNGRPLSSWYAATAGGFVTSYTPSGYTTPAIWDTKCGNQTCWTGDAYEKIAASPWFYKAWYRPRYSRPTRSHPWLSREEFVDIVNSLLLYQKDNGAISHLSQTDKPNPDTWSRDEVRGRLGDEAVSEVTSTAVTYGTNGYTTKVHLETDEGGKDFDGISFREIYNLRAPGEIWLASGLYNLEKK